MSNTRWKPIVMTGTVIVGIILVTVLIIHHSSSRINNLCENSDDLLFIDKSNENGTCYPKNKQGGPCGEKMILVQDMTNTSLGFCDCDNLNNERILIYHQESNQCYFIFTQGYCGSQNEWMVLNKETKQANCEQNKCLSETTTASELVPLKNGTCVELGKSYEFCEKDKVLRFYQGKVYPDCSYSKKPQVKPNVTVGSVGVPQVQCRAGYSLTHLGHCAMNYDFD